jgi:hypothetical protein
MRALIESYATASNEWQALNAAFELALLDHWMFDWSPL